MRPTLLLLLFVALALSSYGQRDTTQPVYKEDYLQKSRRQKTIAYTLAGIGGGLMLTAFLIPRGKKIQEGICIFTWCSSDEYENDKRKSLVGVTGAATALSSLLFFRAAKKNARKVATVGLTMERAAQLSDQNIVYRSFPALRWRLCF